MIYVLTFAVLGLVFVYAAISYQAEIDKQYQKDLEKHYRDWHKHN